MSQYSVPDGFEWDEASGKYINTQILSDENGVRYRRIVLFDAESGEYNQQLIPMNEQQQRKRPLPPPLPEKTSSNMHNSQQKNTALSRGSRTAKSRLGKKKRPKWLVPALIGLSVLLVGLGVFFGYRQLKVDALGYGMMMSDEEVVELLDMDSFVENVESFNDYDGVFLEEGIVK